MTDPTNWLTVRDAARLARCSPRTMRRRMKVLNSQSGGRLLKRNNDEAAGKWWINGKVLDELLSVKRAERQGVANIREELDRMAGDTNDAHERVDELAQITDSQNRRLRKHWNEIKKLNGRTGKNERAVAALKRAVSALSEAAQAIVDEA